MLTPLRCDMDSAWGSNIARAATGRSLIHSLVCEFKPTCVIMPSYVPEGVVHPVLAAGVPILWYPLDSDLTPNFDVFQETLAHAGPKPLVMVIHYFGYPTPIEEISAVVRNAGGLLFEDGAHCLPGTVVEPISDIFMWSLNKVLPVVDGAIMVSKRIALLDIKLDDTNISATLAYFNHLRCNRDFACSRPEQALGPANLSHDAYENYYCHIRSDFTPRKISDYSEAVLALSDIAAITRERRNNAAIINAHLGKYTHRPWERHITPFAYPVLVPEGRLLGDAISALWDAGIHAARCADKWSVARDDRYRHECNFFDRHLLLPVNERIAPVEIARMCAKVEMVLR